MTRHSVLLTVTVASCFAIACHGAEQPALKRSTGGAIHLPAMVANWDPGKQAFVPMPPGSALQSASATPQASAASAAAAPVVQLLPSGKGTFVDLHGGLQSYVVIKASGNGRISTECIDGPGAH